MLATRRLPGPAWNELGDVEVGTAGGTRDDVDVLVVTDKPVDLDRFPALRLVANYGVGYDRVGAEACAARGVAVTNTPGVLDAATADLAVALMLAVRRGVVAGDRYVRAGSWGSHWAEPRSLGREVSGTTLGIVGLGRIGSAVARRAQGFDMHVLHTRRREGDLDALMRESDIVSLHVPLTPETTGLVTRGHLASMKDGATLVNTARGAVVDEDALVDELVSGRIGAGLDVFAHEPHVPPALFGLPNVVLTPHIASATIETRSAMTRIVVDNVLAFSRGETLPTQVA